MLPPLPQNQDIPQHRPWRGLAEIVCVAVLVVVAWHLVGERIASKSFPRGDEGSWMAVAAELSKGNGFTTRWLEHAFLTPYALPRPDDFRYPALTCLLAAAFRVFGTDYAVAHRLVAILFILFGLAVYYTVRRIFGRRTAFATLALVYFSLLQLMYSSEVYTEGLFGIGVALVIYVSCRGSPASTLWWAGTGASIGLLYCIRPNGILFAAGLFAYAFIARRAFHTSVRSILTGFLCMFAVMLPWLLRMWADFGNPFHVATSIGLLMRPSPVGPITATFSEYIAQYDLFSLFKTPLRNMVWFFSLLHEQEHGLELIPLLLCIVGIVRRKRFYNGMVLVSFLLTVIACGYASAMGNWAGVRYISSLLPFIYAYGIYQVFDIAGPALGRLRPLQQKVLSGALTAVVTIALLWPVYHPHRYYERYYAKTPVKSMNFSGYYAALEKKLQNHPFYYAGSLAQINFATGLNCIGMQYFFDSTEVRRAQRTFHPVLMALTPEEYGSPYFNSLMAALRKDGCGLETEIMQDSFAVLVKIKESEIIKGTSIYSPFILRHAQDVRKYVQTDEKTPLMVSRSLH